MELQADVDVLADHHGGEVQLPQKLRLDEEGVQLEKIDRVRFLGQVLRRRAAVGLVVEQVVPPLDRHGAKLRVRDVIAQGYGPWIGVEALALEGHRQDDAGSLLRPRQQGRRANPS